MNRPAGFTDKELEYIYGDVKDKNNIDKNYCFRLTPEMREIFADRAEAQPLTVFRDKSRLVFEIVGVDSCPKRKLEQKEFEAFPEPDKNTGSVIPRALVSNLIVVIIFAVFLIVWLAAIVLKSALNVILGMSLFPIIGAFILFIFMIHTISDLEKRLVTPESEASFGKAVFFRAEPSSGGSDTTSLASYYVDVAFYEEKKILRRVWCSHRVFYMISQGTDVVVCGGRVYAYGKDGRLVAE